MNSVKKIGIGSVQFGLDYGISNDSGAVTQNEINNILSFAKENDINIIDTASTYGDSETKLGISQLSNEFKIVTKLPLVKNISKDEIYNFLVNSFLDSLSKLHLSKCYGLLVHHADELINPNYRNEIIGALKFLKDQHLVEKIGFSFYSESQFNQIIDFFVPDIVQLPINLFDQDFSRTGFLRRLKEFNIEIHSRSCFLQGLVFLKPDLLHPYFNFAQEQLIAFQNILKEYKITPLEAAIAYCKGIPEIDKIIFGICSKNELSEILEAFNKELPPIDWSQTNSNDKNFTDPSRWRLQDG